MNKRLLSMFLTLCMVVTMLPISAMGEETHRIIGRNMDIINFAPLTETEKVVPLGTSMEDLELPETLTATVQTTFDFDTQADTNQRTVTEEVYDPKYEVRLVDISVTWISQPKYDPDTEAEYIFAPVIEDYTVGAVLPEIKVMVKADGAMPLTIIPQGVGDVFLAPITIGEKTDVSWKFIILTEPEGDKNGTVKIYGPDTGREQQYTGALIIPETVTNGGKTYDVTEIAGHALNSCKMSSVFIPKTIGGSIGSDVFSGSSNLAAINVDPNNTSFISEEGVLYNKDKTTLIRYPQAKIGEIFEIPESVKTLSSGAFSGCNNILFINIPENVTKIGESHTFYGCSALKKVTIPSGVSDIPHVAFGNCHALQLITFNGMNAPTLNTYAFGSGDFPKDLKFKIQAGSTGYIGEGASEEWKALADKFEPIPVTNYEVWVGGTQVTSANASDVLGDGKVSYNASTNTLTLTDANIKTVHEFDFNPFSKAISNIYIIGDLNLVLEGSNSIGDSSFNTAEKVSAGIFVRDGNLNISGTGSLTAIGGMTADGNKSAGINLENFDKSLTISGGAEVIAIGAVGYNSYGVHVNGSLIIDGGSLRAEGDGTGESVSSFGVYGGYIDSSFTIKNGGSLTAVGGNAKHGSRGVYFSNRNNNIIVEDGNLTASAGEASGVSTGIRGETISISGGTITASAQKQAIAGDLIFDSGYLHRNTAGLNADGSGATFVNDSTLASGVADYKYIKIEPFNRTPQVISYEASTIAKTYGDTKFINPLTQTTVNGRITYTSDDPSVATVNSATGEVTILAVGDGSATITATASETATHAPATASYTVTVAQKTLTLKVDDKNMTKGDGLPDFTYTVIGLVNGDTMTTLPMMSTTTNGTTIGTFEITISGGVVENGASYDITYINGTLAVAERLFTTTVTNGTGSGRYGEGATVTITANDKIGYTFTGWSGTDVTFANAAEKTTTFTMPAKEVTVTANYRQNNYGGGSSSSSSKDSTDNSSLVIVTPPAPDKPDSPTQGEIKVDSKVDENGNATVNITGKNVTDVFHKAMENANKNGNERNGITVVFRVDTKGKSVSNVMVNLPKAVQDIIISKRIVKTILVVDNPNIKISMDLETVEEINKQANSDVNVTATPGDSSKLTDEAKKAIGNRPVFDLKINYGRGKQVQSFGAGSVSVTIPYTLGENEKAENIWAVYIDNAGKVHWIVGSVYDSVEKVLRFSTNHFSTYGVGYKEEIPAFKDIENHWAKEDIEFVASLGFFKGTSETTFSPNSTMTRGMFITVLGRMANADVTSYIESSFTDVKNGAYYLGYIEWAREKGIVNGTGNGRFTPDESMTREQMVVIMQNYAKAMGFTLPKIHGENTFADSTIISAYAKGAVKEMQMAGVLRGKNYNLFNPQDEATRAEVSAVLHRFLIHAKKTMLHVAEGF